MVENTVNRDVADWLAAATGDDPAEVAAALALGERRRAFVFNELTEAGYTGAALLDYLMRLTGIDERHARALIEEHDRQSQEEQADARPRDTSLAQNEIAFRDANEVIAHSGSRALLPDVIEVVCECSDRDCRRVLTMPFAEYEWLRQNPWRFVVLPGHDAPAVERVAELHDAYAIVEKHPETRQQVESADPRS
jgi:hypothetical protein